MTTLTPGHTLRAVTCTFELAETRYANRPLSMAICNANGELLSFARMDNVKLLTTELTQHKARAGSRLGCITQAPLQRLQKGRPDTSYSADPRFTTPPGGILILYREKCLGAAVVDGLPAQEDHDAALPVAEILLKEITQRRRSPCCMPVQPPLQ